MSLSLITSHPPATHNVRPERPDHVPNFIEKLVHNVVGRRLANLSRKQALATIVARVDALTSEFASQGDHQLKETAKLLGVELHRGGLSEPLVARCFALVREVAGRTIGMRHFGSQLVGGRALLQGCLAEMETGEGKTLTATLAAVTAALAGIPVHVVSVNDYLTSRDAEEMGPIYRAVGLTVGCVVHGMTPQQRRHAYGCQVTYVTNKELVFDYLRDRLVLKERLDPLNLQAESLHGGRRRVDQLMLRGLHFALVDEADSILIDEARTPLIISGSSENEEEREFLEQAISIADALSEGADYFADSQRRQVRLTENGRRIIEIKTEGLGRLWKGLVWREAVVGQALTARHFFRRDEQYLVRDGKVQIIDEFTGRVMPDRSWEQGLHQLIEVMEGCELTKRREPLAKVSYQKFFRRYLMLAGMTGTAREVAGEVWETYSLPTVRIPTNRPVIRCRLPGKVMPNVESKWSEIVTRIRKCHDLGRPVLVGTRSVAASEHLSKLVSEAGLEHQVINAKQDKAEAQIVKGAGYAGKITIATNMAGRGTDIKLGPGVRKAGGLHVIATERHEAARIDRQLAGRGGRQGDPGSYEEILSREDPLLLSGLNSFVGRLVRRSVPLKIYRLVFWAVQKKMETYHRQVRKELFRKDQQQGSLLSFSGRME